MKGIMNHAPCSGMKVIVRWVGWGGFKILC